MPRKSRKQKTSEPCIEILKTAIYARLSFPEGKAVESINTQIDIVKDFLKNKPFFRIIGEYSDNGFTGTDFNRPAFQRLIEDIRNGKINCVVVKDLSRFGRNHIAVGDYIENIFPFLGVRFISVLDEFDNINVDPDELFLTSFKNFVHAYFAKETSRKTIIAIRELQEKGLFVGSKAPYGYEKDPKDKHKLIIDEKVAPIIREIFERYANGETTRQIATDLNNRSILSPIAYAREKYGRNFRSYGSCWNLNIVGNIIQNPRYIGTLTQHLRSKAFYRNISPHRVEKDDQCRVENAIPPIITKEIWERVSARKLRGNPKIKSEVA